MHMWDISGWVMVQTLVSRIGICLLQLGVAFQESSSVHLPKYYYQRNNQVAGLLEGNHAMQYTVCSGSTWPTTVKAFLDTGGRSLTVPTTHRCYCPMETGRYLGISHTESILSVIYGWKRLAKRKDLLRHQGYMSVCFSKTNGKHEEAQTHACVRFCQEILFEWSTPWHTFWHKFWLFTIWHKFWHVYIYIEIYI